MVEIMLREQKSILIPIKSVAIIDQILERHTQFLNDSEVTRYLRIKDATAKYQRKRLLNIITSSNQFAMAVLNGINEYDIQSIGSRYVGMTTFREIDMYDLTAHSGLMIGDKSVWRTGFGKEAKLLQLYYAFMVMKLRWVYGRTFRLNKGSVRILEGTGYVQQGIRPNCRRIGTDFHDELLFGVNKKQWRAIWNTHAIEPI